jgi:2-oxoglutarate ferredoxin oxidoreductase subunit gamma
MTNKIIIAGAGGQGVMLVGKVLAEAAMREGKFVTWLPAYGAEVRGGTANCLVVISDEEIASPLIAQADVLIVLNEPSLVRFQKRVKDQGLLVLNDSLISAAHDPRLKSAKHPFSDEALKLGNIKVTNMVALGCFIERTGIVTQKTVESVIKDLAPSDRSELAALNINALSCGISLARSFQKKKGNK